MADYLRGQIAKMADIEIMGSPEICRGPAIMLSYATNCRVFFR
jgi:hypothetical protein